MIDFSKLDGVWRTIGGRRVFIQEGQSLSSAMKSSGKFKSGKKGKVGKVEEVKDHTFKMNDEEKKKYEEVGKKIDNLSKEIDEEDERLEIAKKIAIENNPSLKNASKELLEKQARRIMQHSDGEVTTGEKTYTNSKGELERSTESLKERLNNLKKSSSNSREEEASAKRTQERYEKEQESKRLAENTKQAKSESSSNKNTDSESTSKTITAGGRNYEVLERYKSPWGGEDVYKVKNGEGKIEYRKKSSFQNKPVSETKRINNETNNTMSKYAADLKRGPIGVDTDEYAETIKTPKNAFEKAIVDHKKNYEELVDVTSKRRDIYQGFDDSKAKDHLSKSDYKKFQELSKKQYSLEAKGRKLARKIDDEYEKNPSVWTLKDAEKEIDRTSAKEYKSAKRFHESVLKNEKKMSKAEVANTTRASEARSLKTFNDKRYNEAVKNLNKKNLTPAQRKMWEEVRETHRPGYSDITRSLYTSGEIKKSNKESTDWIRNAFNEYKKEHPNSKMTIGKFKKDYLS